MMMTQRLLVPVDFSADANQALEYAIALARTLGARVILLHVMQSPPWGDVDMDVTIPHAYSRFVHRIGKFIFWLS
jgi:nucleotide-binding universal stress UspA family protein